jgi:hypothetical protein
MKLTERYHRLSLWNKIAFWGALASIAALLMGIVFYIFPRNGGDAPLGPEDFRLRFAVISYDLTTNDLKRAPVVLHCKGRLGLPSIEFDLQLVPTIAYASSRSRPIPMIWYESEHFTVITTELLNRHGVAGNRFIFTLPSELRGFAGPDTKFTAELYVRDKRYWTGTDDFQGGTVEIRM